MEGISHRVYSGPARAPHRSLLRALGVGRGDSDRPLIGIANSYNEWIPGHMHLNSIAQQVKYGVYQGGGIPLEFNVIGVCDGLAMNHEGMNYSLVSREVIADSVEIMAKAHGVDGLVLIPNCDKIVPGMVMAAARLGHPRGAGLRRPHAGRRLQGQEGQPLPDLRRLGPVLQRRHHQRRTVRPGRRGLSHLRLLRRSVHRQLHGLRHGDLGPHPARRRYHPCRLLLPAHTGPEHRRRGCRRGPQQLDRPQVHH